MKRYRLGVLTLILILLSGFLAKAQHIPEHISNQALYEFMDELANMHVIDLASVVKPYTRMFIASKLQEANLNKEKLNSRQQQQLRMYLNDYVIETGETTPSHLALLRKDSTLLMSLLPPVLTYRDALFRFTLKPIYGLQYHRNNNGNIRHTWGGADVQASIGNNCAVWASLRDNYQKNGILAKPSYFTLHQGGNYKVNEGGRAGGDYSEMRGGIAWSWKWGSVSLQKDHEMWGDNYHGANILSGRTPSFAKISLHMYPAKWLDFHYFHGWLVSEVVDSTRSYITSNGDKRTVFRNKYIAANMFTVTPLKRLNISLGNSIIYSDMNVHPAYLIPFMFFKSIDHTVNHNIDNQNSQMFLNISSRQIKHLHLFFTWFVDEFSKTRITDKDRHNFTSTKGGFRLDGWPLSNLSLTGEYTFTYPLTFKHRVPAITFETNKFNLGHYLRDNSREMFFMIQSKPFRGLTLDLSYTNAAHGNEYAYVFGPTPVDQNPFMKELTWENTTISLRSAYHFYHNASVFFEYYMSNVKGYEADGKTAQYYLNQYTPTLFHGKTNNLSFGFQFGF